MHPRPKRVGSSLVNMSASIGFSGSKPASPESLQRCYRPNYP